MDQTSPTSQQEPEPEPQQSIILLGNSNCRDIQPHLMTWTNQAVEMVWAPTIQDAKNWTTANRDEIGCRIVVLLVGTNDLKNHKDKNEVSAMHRVVTQAISETGAQLIVAQLPPVYHPQPRAESRRRDTELINKILLERHGQWCLSHNRRHRSSSRTKRSSKRDAPSSSKGQRTPSPHTSKDRKSPQRERSRRDDSREKSCDRYDRRTPSPYRPDKYSREKSRDRYDRRTPSPNRPDKYSSRRYRPSPDWRERTPSPDRSRSRSSNRRRSRSYSPHREATRYRHQPRSYDEKDLERAISNILARRGLR